MLIVRSCSDFAGSVPNRQGFNALTGMDSIILLARATIGNVPLAGVLITIGLASQ